MQKGQVLIWIIVGALIVIIAAGTYYLGRQTSSKSSATPIDTSPASPAKRGEQTPQTTLSPASSPDETANWKTYTNKALRFTFSYPDGYVLEKEDAEKVTFSGLFQPGNQVIPSELILNFKQTINLQSMKKCKDVEFQDNITTSCIDGDIETKEFNGVKMNVFQLLKGSKNTQSDATYVTQVINVPKIEFVHRILGGGVETRMDQILSTFRFTQ